MRFLRESCRRFELYGESGALATRKSLLTFRVIVAVSFSELSNVRSVKCRWKHTELSNPRNYLTEYME